MVVTRRRLTRVLEQIARVVLRRCLGVVDS
jgi:hypothetical protein